MSNEKKTYVKVRMSDAGETHCIVTYHDAIEALRFHILEDEFNTEICFTPIEMTEKEFNNLPDFKGF